MYLSYLLTHGSEPFWRSCQFCSHLRISQHFMEPEDSLPCLQEPTIFPIQSQIKRILTIPYYRSKIHFNIVHPPTPWSSQRSLSPSGFPTNILYPFPFFPICATCPAHLTEINLYAEIREEKVTSPIRILLKVK
jgi:hypothetical protein